MLYVQQGCLAPYWRRLHECPQLVLVTRLRRGTTSVLYAWSNSCSHTHIRWQMYQTVVLLTIQSELFFFFSSLLSGLPCCFAVPSRWWLSWCQDCQSQSKWTSVGLWRPIRKLAVRPTCQCEARNWVFVQPMSSLKYKWSLSCAGHMQEFSFILVLTNDSVSSIFFFCLVTLSKCEASLQVLVIGLYSLNILHWGNNTNMKTCSGIPELVWHAQSAYSFSHYFLSFSRTFLMVNNMPEHVSQSERS